MQLGWALWQLITVWDFLMWNDETIERAVERDMPVDKYKYIHMAEKRKGNGKHLLRNRFCVYLDVPNQDTQKTRPDQHMHLIHALSLVSIAAFYITTPFSVPASICSGNYDDLAKL